MSPTPRILVSVAIGLVSAFALLVAPAAPAQAAYTDYGLHYCSTHDTVVDYGDTTTCVKTIQTFLHYRINGRGFGPICTQSLAPTLAVDGVFGSQTKAYVKCFQQMVNGLGSSFGYTATLTVDGVVGPKTYAQMLRACTYDAGYILASEGTITNKWFCTK